MFTTVHNGKESYKYKRDVIYRHLYEANIKQLIKENKVITDIWKEICIETANADIKDLVISGNLDSYYKRLKVGAV